jgi:nicotinic acid mononucleotide adenylyltransferase
VENGSKIIGIYGGGFKPPTKGHFEVAQQALKQHPEIDTLLIYVGSGERDKIDQAESVLVWDIYQKHLPSKVSIEAVKSPIGDIFKYAKDHPEEKIYFILGAREGSEGDQTDIASRTKSVKEKYPNIEVKIITTPDSGISGTNARKALMTNKEAFFKYLPSVLNSTEKERVYATLTPELVSENATYSNIDYKNEIRNLTNYMFERGENIFPLPKVIFKHSNIKNAENFLGKTAYYEPQSMSVVLYTEGRHPKDIVRSFAHEMIHHMQNLEGRLGNISTTDTNEDGNLQEIEEEAYLKGNILFRRWTDHMKYNRIHESILLEEEDKLMAEVVNPDGEHFQYQESNTKGLFTYKDSQDNLYFARIFYQPTSNPHFEFKVGWFKDNDLSKPQYDPPLPSSAIGIDNLKRRNTVAKIYRDEIIPYFKKNLSLSNTLTINPISDLRYTFSKRLVQNHTPKDFDIQYDNKNQKFINISSKKMEEKNNKDPFGITAYALELARGLEEQEGSKYKIYVDMDGVIVDFDGGYEKLTGITTKEADKKGPEFFWKPISKAGAKWWITLKWMPDGKQLWDYVKKYNPELLSAPSREEASRLGKRVWVKRELPGVKLILRSADKKQEFASSNSILIDDREKNIEQWRNAGGIGVLHTDAASTIKQLKDLGL